MKSRLAFAALLSGILFAPPAAAEPPAVFVSMLYSNYKDMDHWAKNYDPCDKYCEADLGKLLKAAHRKNMIDYDPVCQCQHGGENYMMFAGSRGATDDDYRVTMKKVGKPGTWLLILRWADGGWKIRDVLETRSGKQVSLRQRLASATT
jgi:hypothetical protein